MAPCRATQSHQQKPSPPWLVWSPEDRFSPSSPTRIKPSEATKGSGAPDEILTYGYVKSRDPHGSRPKGPPADPSRITWGLYPSGTLVRTLRPRNLTELGHSAAPAQGSGACPGLRLLIDDTPKLGPWFLPGLRHQPRPGCKKTSPEPLRQGRSKTIGSCTGRDIRRQASHSLQGLDDSLCYQEDSRRSTGGGRSKPTQPDMKSVRTEQPDDAQDFFGSTTPP
jgi:hypothetical protein